MYRRILVGTDGSSTAARAVDRAVEVAQATGAKLTVLTATMGRQRGERVVAAEADRHAGSGVEIDTLVVVGEPVSALLDAGDSGDYDLLVVGNKGMTGPGRFFHLGSVPNKVSHHLPCTLLIVRTT